MRRLVVLALALALLLAFLPLQTREITAKKIAGGDPCSLDLNNLEEGSYFATFFSTPRRLDEDTVVFDIGTNAHAKNAGKEVRIAVIEDFYDQARCREIAPSPDSFTLNSFGGGAVYNVRANIGPGRQPRRLTFGYQVPNDPDIGNAWWFSDEYVLAMPTSTPTRTSTPTDTPTPTATEQAPLPTDTPAATATSTATQQVEQPTATPSATRAVPKRPNTPSGLKATVRRRSSSSWRATLTWRDRATNETVYYVERATMTSSKASALDAGDSVEATTHKPTATPRPAAKPKLSYKVVAKLKRNTTTWSQTLKRGTYYYRVRACNSGGCSKYAGPVKVTAK